MGITRDQANSHGGPGMQVGIDPAGGAGHTAPRAFSMAIGGRATWTSGARASGTRSPSFPAKCDFPVHINASHWGDLELLVGEPDEVHPSEPATTVPLGDLTLDQVEQIIRRIVREELGDA